MARPPKRSASLHRRHSQVDQLPTWLVVCEGKTEKSLLTQLRGRWRIPSITVEVIGQVGVPRTIVDHAKDRCDQFDQVWVVFDRDERPCWSDAIQKAKDNGFRLAVSNPCIELWGLLLHQDQMAPLDRKHVQRNLKAVHRGYDHRKHPYLDIEVVLAAHSQAFDRAEALLKSATVLEEHFRCPTTRFHYLLEALRKLQLK